MTSVAEEADRIGAAYLARLTDTDLRTVVRAEQTSREQAANRIAALRRQPALILDVLDRPATSAAVLDIATDRLRRSELTFVSPFLLFAAAIHRTAADLTATSYAPERTSPRMRVPVFDALQLAGYLATPRHRLFLADLLSSFARISAGTIVTRTARGLRRRHWSDADPDQLSVLFESLPPAQWPAVWRRLGDLAPFLVGVFPDAAEQVAPSRLAAARLARRTLLEEQVPDAGAVELLEWLGAAWYRRAAHRAGAAGGAAALRETAEQFRPARRVLNTTADRYLFPVQSALFGR
jgi:hypothetical protein